MNGTYPPLNGVPSHATRLPMNYSDGTRECWLASDAIACPSIVASARDRSSGACVTVKSAIGIQCDTGNIYGWHKCVWAQVVTVTCCSLHLWCSKAMLAKWRSQSVCLWLTRARGIGGCSHINDSQGVRSTTIARAVIHRQLTRHMVHQRLFVKHSTCSLYSKPNYY